MEHLKTIQKRLVDRVLEYTEDLCHANTYELDKAIDMIKDMAEAMYYCKVTTSMEEHTEMTTPETIEGYIQKMNKEVMALAETATPEQKQMIQQRLATLAAKIK